MFVCLRPTEDLGKGGMDQIFFLRMIREKFLAVNQEVFCAFVNLEKAFDRFVRTKLWENLPRYNMGRLLLRTVKSLYRNHSVSEALVTTLKGGCKNNGLSMNGSKTKILVFERYEERTE